MKIVNWRKAPQQPLPAHLALRASPSAQQYQYPGRVSVDYSVPVAWPVVWLWHVKLLLCVFMCVIGST